MAPPENDGPVAANPRAVRGLAAVLRRPEWRDIRLDMCAFFAASASSSSAPCTPRRFEAFEEPPYGVGGGVGGAGWVSCRLTPRREALYGPPARHSGSQPLLPALAALDAHPRLRRLHLRCGELPSEAHAALLDLLIGCRRLKGLVVSAELLTESFMATLSSGLMCAVRLESLALEARTSAPIGAGAIFALVQAAVAAGRVSELRMRITAAPAEELEPLTFALETILAAPRRPLSIKIEGNVSAPTAKSRAVLEALRRCKAPKGVTLTCNLKPL